MPQYNSLIIKTVAHPAYTDKFNILLKECFRFEYAALAKRALATGKALNPDDERFYKDISAHFLELKYAINDASKVAILTKVRLRWHKEFKNQDKIFDTGLLYEDLYKTLDFITPEDFRVTQDSLRVYDLLPSLPLDFSGKRRPPGNPTSCHVTQVSEEANIYSVKIIYTPNNKQKEEKQCQE